MRSRPKGRSIPEWDKRPRNLWQQYELHVQRLDQRLDESLEQLYVKASAKACGKGLRRTIALVTLLPACWRTVTRLGRIRRLMIRRIPSTTSRRCGSMIRNCLR